MGSKGGFILLGLLLFLAVLCHSGHGLTCFSCMRPFYRCTTNQTCAVNYNTCLYVDAGINKYFQCWKKDDCKFDTLAKHFGEKELQYRCCQQDMCNKDPEGGNSKAAGKTALLEALLAAPLLATAWNLCL
ncbi:CD59 glycoprotein [Erinaceus europaeus]|uniref:MAC-inhibitory protein n=1 Tax=Erinaceus europaeus TaxID=9365 RepID=A0A1S3W9A5_ERIEU|nr:CD59 glycoprotein [Erinaceus europaeus]